MTDAVVPAGVAVPVVHGEGFLAFVDHPWRLALLGLGLVLTVIGHTDVGDRLGTALRDVGVHCWFYALLFPMLWSAVVLAPAAQAAAATEAFENEYDLTLVKDPDPGFFGFGTPRLPRSEGQTRTVYAARDGALLVCLVTVVDGVYAPACTSDGRPVNLDGRR